MFVFFFGSFRRCQWLATPKATTKHASATSAGWAISRDLLPDDHQKVPKRWPMAGRFR
jgi:hypothetical protein